MRPPAPWAILDVDLARPLEALRAPPEASGILVVFRFRGAVLGFGSLLPCELPLSTGELARFSARTVAPIAADWLRIGNGYDTPATGVRSQRTADVDPLLTGSVLGRLDRVFAERRTRPAHHTASIVICTRGRPDALEGCLTSVAPEIARGREVLVVDNGPDPQTEAVVRRIEGARYIPEPRPGLSVARNTGIAAATGELVLFVDDDVRPEPGWADALVQAFDHEAVAVACGLVLPDALEEEAQIAFQYDLGFGGMGLVPLCFDWSFLQGWRRGVPVWEVGAGANMAVRRSTVLRLGGFDERIGPGAAGGCGDDSEFWHRALFNGATIHYEPLSIVRHQHRRQWDDLARQAYGYGFGHVVALFAQSARDGDPGDLARTFLTMPSWYAGRLRRAPRRWLLGEPDRLLWSEIRGYLSGVSRFRLFVDAFRRKR